MYGIKSNPSVSVSVIDCDFRFDFAFHLDNPRFVDVLWVRCERLTAALHESAFFLIFPINSAQHRPIVDFLVAQSQNINSHTARSECTWSQPRPKRLPASLITSHLLDYTFHSHRRRRQSGKCFSFSEGKQ